MYEQQPQTIRAEDQVAMAPDTAQDPEMASPYPQPLGSPYPQPLGSPYPQPLPLSEGAGSGNQPSDGGSASEQHEASTSEPHDLSTSSSTAHEHGECCDECKKTCKRNFWTEVLRAVVKISTIVLAAFGITSFSAED